MIDETTTTTPELAPCLFCGKETELVHDFVECMDFYCGYEGPVQDIDGTRHNSLAASVALGKLAPKLAEAMRFLLNTTSPQELHDAADECDVVLAEFDALTAATKEATQ